MDDNEITEHPSFALMQFVRVQGGDNILFGSSIKHDNRIMLRINRSEHCRNFHKFSYYPKEKYIEVEMSESQFAEAITSMNMGTGVPVTLRSLNGKKIEQHEFVNTRIKHQEDFAKDMKAMADKFSDIVDEAEKLLSAKRPPTIK